METTEFRSRCTRILSELRASSTFLTIHNYKNNFGEISDYSIVFHVDYLHAVQRSLDLLTNFDMKSFQLKDRPYTIREVEQAKKELLVSFELSLDGKNISTSAHAYTRLSDGTGNTIKGVKLHDGQDLLHLEGFRVYKNVKIPGVYPPDRRRALTIAKDDLRSMLPIGKIVQFRLQPGKFEKFVVCGMTIKEEDVIRKNFNLMIEGY